MEQFREFVSSDLAKKLYEYGAPLNTILKPTLYDGISNIGLVHSGKMENGMYEMIKIPTIGDVVSWLYKKEKVVFEFGAQWEINPFFYISIWKQNDKGEWDWIDDTSDLHEPSDVYIEAINKTIEYAKIHWNYTKTCLDQYDEQFDYMGYLPNNGVPQKYIDMLERCGITDEKIKEYYGQRKIK